MNTETLRLEENLRMKSNLFWGQGEMLICNGECNIWHVGNSTAVNYWFSHWTWQTLAELKNIQISIFDTQMKTAREGFPTEDIFSQ